MRNEGYGSWVCLSVCLSVKPHLTSGASVCPEIDNTYSTSNQGQKNCGNFSEIAPLRKYTASCIVWLSVQSAILLCENVHAHCISARFEHGGSSKSNTKGDLVCPKHCLPTYVASPCIHRAGSYIASCVSVSHAYFLCKCMYVCAHKLAHAYVGSP